MACIKNKVKTIIFSIFNHHLFIYDVLFIYHISKQDPCIIFEPKTLYRASVEEVPDQSFECPLGKADILQSGKDVTLIGWGTQVHVLTEVAQMAKKELNIDCEVIDLVSILPWDQETVCKVSE